MFKDFSIFKKLLIAPGVALTFFIIFLAYTYTQHTLAQKNLLEVKQRVQPMLELANKNISLFDRIHKTLQDAVAAQELVWISHTRSLQQELLQNLAELQSRSEKPLEVTRMREHFERYYESAYFLSTSLIKTEGMALERSDQLIPQMIDFKNRSEAELKTYKQTLQNSFDRTLKQASAHLDDILFFGALLGVLSVVLSMVITLLIALPIRKSLGSVVGSLSALAQAKPDFSNTLEYAGNDEIGKFATAFNTFSLKVKKDYTALQETRELLEVAKEKAEQATKSKSMFLANMSHEIRTPMNGIIGMTYLVKQTRLDEQQRNYVNKIASSSNLLLGIINDILDFSKIEACKLDIVKTHANLEEIVQNVFYLLEEPAKEKGLDFHFTTDALQCPQIHADALRISQILTNLLSNALKFTSKGYVSLNVSQQENTYRFEIKDSGIGLTPEQQEHLFESFTQADATTTRQFGGTGLGLAICKQLVEMMGGRIWVESEPGKGSSFIFELDFEESCAEQVGASAQKDPQLLREKLKSLEGVKKILLVEDNAMNREITHSLLEGMPFEIVDAHDGKEAVAIYEAEGSDFSLILMDLQMPVMDGYEAAERIRANDQEIPIIALSASALDEDVVRSRASGMNMHVNKPVVVEEFYAVLLQYLNPGSEQAAVGMETAGDIVLDKAAGLRHVNGNEVLYKKLLNDFCAGYHDAFEKLAAMQKDESLQFVHTFKGMSATLGANQLYQALKQYENEQTPSHKETAEAALQAFLASIDFKSDVQPSPQEGHKKPLDTKAQAVLVDALKEALHSHKPQKIKPLMQAMGTVELSENYAALLPKLQQLVASYQFHEALELLGND